MTDGMSEGTVEKIKRLRAENTELRNALQELLDYKWSSVEKDNMEFSARVTCYTLEKARKALVKH